MFEVHNKNVEELEDESLTNAREAIRSKLLGQKAPADSVKNSESPFMTQAEEDFMTKQVEDELTAEGYGKNKKGIWEIGAVSEDPTEEEKVSPTENDEAIMRSRLTGQKIPAKLRNYRSTLMTQAEEDFLRERVEKALEEEGYKQNKKKIWEKE